MKITTLVVGMLMANCYIVSGDGGKRAIVVDPGDDLAAILASLEEQDLIVAYIVDTHNHFDHNGVDAELKAATGAPICVNPDDDGAGLPDPLRGPKRLKADVPLAGGEELAADGVSLRVFKTPGHSPGSVSLLGDGVLFGGDLVFRGSIGRTDFPGGDAGRMRESLKWLSTLADDTVVYPGHGEPFRLGDEKTSNPFLKTWAGGADE